MFVKSIKRNALLGVLGMGGGIAVILSSILLQRVLSFHLV